MKREGTVIVYNCDECEKREVVFSVVGYGMAPLPLGWRRREGRFPHEDSALRVLTLRQDLCGECVEKIERNGGLDFVW